MRPIAEAQENSKRVIREQITGGTLGGFTIDLLSTIAPTLSCWVKNNIGRESTQRAVTGRDSTEDVEIEIDEKAEKFIYFVTRRLAGQYGLSISILSEHNNYEVGDSKNPSYTMVVDPIENSDEYKRRLPTPPFSHFQLYARKNQPVTAGATNLATGEMYLALSANNANYYFQPELNKLLPMPEPRRITSVKNGEVAIASYDGKPKYSVPFSMLFDRLIEDTVADKGSRHGKGGSHSYIDLATGAIGAYIMFAEPRGETDAAYLFARNAGCKVVSADLQTGAYEDYTFDPQKQYERTPLLIAARSDELVKEIINYYMCTKTEWETKKLISLKTLYEDYLGRSPDVAGVVSQIFPALKAA